MDIARFGTLNGRANSDTSVGNTVEVLSWGCRLFGFQGVLVLSAQKGVGGGSPERAKIAAHDWRW